VFSFYIAENIPSSTTNENRLTLFSKPIALYRENDIKYMKKLRVNEESYGKVIAVRLRVAGGQLCY